MLRWGADETQLDGRGRSASDIAGALTNVFDRGHRHAEEVERIRVMLANAPAERRWNRRRAVVIVVSRLRGNIARERSWSREAEKSGESGGDGGGGIISNAAKKRGSGGGVEGVAAAAAAAVASVVDATAVVVGVDEAVGGAQQLAVESGFAVAAVNGGENQQQPLPLPCGMEAFRDAVVRLAREDDEGVFRSVVSFL